jgi:hypothetical protein
MAQKLKEIALLEDVSSLPSGMQLVYMQLVSAIDSALTKLRTFGAQPEQLSEEFIENIVTQLIEKEISQVALEDRVEQEFQKKILEEAQCAAVC